jgi:peptide/nickel transport system permease protein
LIQLIAQRVLLTIPTVLGVIFIVVMVLRLAPGDPVRALFVGDGQAVDEDVVEVVRKQLGLDQPLPVQYVNYVWNVARLDFGRSYWSGASIRDELVRRFPRTLALGIAALTIAYAIGIPAGLIAAYKPNSWIDNSTMFVSLVGMSTPHFWLGFLLMILFGLNLGWLPMSGYGGPLWTVEGLRHVALPAFTLSLGPAAIVARLLRSGMVEVMQREYITVARSKGLHEWIVVVRHGARNALLAVLAIMGLQFGQLLGGAVVIETIFNWPGLGSFAVEGIRNRDYPVVQAVVILGTIAFVLGNLLSDIALRLADPRIRI